MSARRRFGFQVVVTKESNSKPGTMIEIRSKWFTKKEAADRRARKEQLAGNKFKIVEKKA